MSPLLPTRHSPFIGAWPRHVRAVGDDGVVYEGQPSNEETGEYHGYPMKKDDGFAGFIGEEWERRGT